MERLLRVFAYLCGSALCCLGGQVTVSDNANTITGRIVTSLSVSWQGFTTVDGVAVGAGTTTVPVSNGQFSVQLAPNAGTPAFYTFNFRTQIGSNPQGGSSALLSALVVVPGNVSTATFAQCQVTASWYTGPSTGNPGTGPGSGGTSGNATSILTIPLSVMAPADGQGWLYNAATARLEPVTIPYWKKFTLSYSQLQQFTALTGTVTLAMRAVRQKVCGASFYVTAAFAGTSISSINASLGDSNGTPTQYTPVPTNLIDVGSADYNIMAGSTGSSMIQANVTAVGANLSALTAGNLDVIVCLVNLPQ